jgi:hypothetical protein
MDTHANVLRWRENAFRRDRVEPSSWVIDRHQKGLNSEILSRQNEKVLESSREREYYQTSPLEVCPCVGLFASTLSTLSHHG